MNIINDISRFVARALQGNKGILCHRYVSQMHGCKALSPIQIRVFGILKPEEKDSCFTSVRLVKKLGTSIIDNRAMKSYPNQARHEA